MIELFHNGGFMMWPILVCALIVLALAAKGGRRLLDTERSPRAHAAIAAIPFWGGFAVVLGVLGTVVGWMQIARNVERAGTMHTSLIWGGFGISLITTLFGLLVLAVSLLVWLGLWLPGRRLAAEAAAEARVEAPGKRDDFALEERLERLEERLRFTESLLESRAGRTPRGEAAG
ncbi:MAG: MotA/TolQ/ExbB proton channel family protein [Gemmatimonadota bacterium]